MTTPIPSNRPDPECASKHPPMLHRVIRAGYLRYWIITAWALALSITVPWRYVAAWFGVTVAAGLIRTFVERRPARSSRGSLPLIAATASCIAWAAAPLLAYFKGSDHGLTMAVALLMAGYMLVFTQMRAAPREALIVSAPYSIVVVILAVVVPGFEGTWTILSIVPVLGLSLLIKVAITQMKDGDLAKVNARQASLIEDLALSRDRADAASEAKSNFLAVVSHELRTPLNGVLGAAQLLENTGLNEVQETYVSIIRQSGAGLLVQLNDILDLTKIETGHMELNPVEVEATTLVERVIGPFRAQAEAKGLKFHVEIDGPLPAVVRVDPLRVAQISHNLLGNAVKFTDAGGITLGILREKVANDRARLCIRIADTGVGIADADLPQLFQPFTQVDASSTRRFGGTGLGLSICRQLADLMGGEVTVSSVSGEGSVFTFVFDVDVLDWADPAPVEVLEAEGASEDARGLRVLVVEDHPVNRLVLQTWLEAVGHSCAVAENGQLALDAAKVEAFDLIIMDVNMPVMDGLTATRALRAQPGPNQDVPLAILSASARQEDHALGHAAGADAYVAKPVDFSDLARVLAAAAHGRAPLRSDFGCADAA